MGMMNKIKETQKVDGNIKVKPLLMTVISMIIY